MAKEVRCILFERSEARDAVVEYLASRLRDRRASKIARVDFVDHLDGACAEVHYAADLGLEMSVIEPPDLLGALLMFCSNRRIPLPRRAPKSLELSGDNVVLTISSNIASLTPPAVAKSRVSQVDPGVRKIAINAMANAKPK